MSAAETLRKAAALMRERAKAALGPDYEWTVAEDATGHRVWWAFVDGAHLAANGILSVNDMPGWTDRVVLFEHITGWHPAVALAVADWLDLVACILDDGFDANAETQAALVVAHAYLGEEV